MNLLDRIEPHAKRLEDAAEKMEAAGIGGEANGGHVAVLRKMAGSMRADAARGKVPHAYAADVLRAADSGSEQISIIKAAKARLYELRTPVEACEAAPMHLNTIRWLRAELKRMNYDLKLEENVDVFKLDQCMAGHDTEKRIAIKSAMASLKLIAP